MFDPETAIDVLHRIAEVRRARCGELAVPPPPGWQKAVQVAWPSMWFRPPWRVADGWCDIILAMSAHLAEIDPAAQCHDAFENTVDGFLTVRVETADEEAVDVAVAYHHVAMETCRVCGEVGSRRMRAHRSPAILCDRHAEGP